jgi:hypothetical protein
VEIPCFDLSFFIYDSLRILIEKKQLASPAVCLVTPLKKQPSPDDGRQKTRKTKRRARSGKTEPTGAGMTKPARLRKDAETGKGLNGGTTAGRERENN